MTHGSLFLDGTFRHDGPFLALAESLDELVYVWTAAGEMLWVNPPSAGRRARRVAGDGTEGVSLFRNNPVDAVILDGRLPGETGPTIAATLRQLRPGVPLLLSSGYQEDTGTSFEAFLPKPSTSTQLIAAVGQLLPG